MAQGLLAGRDATNVVRLPPPGKFGTAVPKPREQFLERGIASPQIVRGAELRHDTPRFFFPGRTEQLSRRAIGQHIEQRVAIIWREAAEREDFCLLYTSPSPRD